MKLGMSLIALEIERQAGEKERSSGMDTGYCCAQDLAWCSADVLHWEDRLIDSVERSGGNFESKLGWAATKTQRNSLTDFAGGHDASTVPGAHSSVFVADERVKCN